LNGLETTLFDFLGDKSGRMILGREIAIPLRFAPERCHRSLSQPLSHYFKISGNSSASPRTMRWLGMFGVRQLRAIDLVIFHIQWHWA